MSFNNNLNLINRIAVYDNIEGIFLGELKMILIPYHTGFTPLFSWQTKPNFHIISDIFTPFLDENLPVFIRDFIHNYNGNKIEILNYIILNHTASQNSLTFLYLDNTEIPTQSLSEKIICELALRRYVPATVITRWYNYIPIFLHKYANTLIQKSLSNPIAESLALLIENKILISNK